MRFSFKKIGSVLASTAMLSSTVALAAAANFPAPFVAGGAANVAIVHGGADAAYTDLVAVTDVTSYLSSELARQTATGGTNTVDANIQGESAPLFTGGSKLFLNDSINSVRNVLTKTDLPTVLSDGSFSGNVDATVTHTIEIGSTPLVKFAKEPTSSFDPDFGLYFSSTQANYLYNATASFSKTINLTHADSVGEDIELFGQTYTISSSTSGTDLILLKSAERISLSNEDPSAEVTVAGNTYTVEFRTSSDTGATIKVTDANGNSAEKEITEGQSKKVGGVMVAVINADENNLLLSATVVVGSEKVTLTSGSQVTFGDENTVIDGTLVTFSGSVPALNKIIISGYAPTSDEDFLKGGESYADPVWGSFKYDFAGLNVPTESTAREEIKVSNSGDDKATLTFTDYRGKDASSIQWATNTSTAAFLQKDSDGRNITVVENGVTADEEYVVVGNEDEAHLLRVSQITNQTGSGSNTYSDDKVTFVDVLSGDTYTTATPSTEGSASVIIGGKTYSVKYFGAATDAQSDRSVRINYADSDGQAVILYPTIQTSKGAKLAFYTPQTLTLTNWDGFSNSVTGLKFPDGDGYTDVTIGAIGERNGTSFNVTCGGVTTAMSTEVGAGSATNVGCAVGALTYNITAGTTANSTIIRLNNPQTNLALYTPAVVVFEEKDDNTVYNAMVVTLEPGASSDDGIGVDDVIRTWSKDGEWDVIALHSDSKVTKEADLWGSIVTVDGTDSDQKTATISYPDEQLYAQVYVGQADSTVTPGSTPGGSGSVVSLGSVAVADSEAGSVASKNLIVVGGSCVNSIAAELLGVSNPTCGADFTAKTGVGAGQYLIETFSRSTGKVATLVAGYNAGDTTNAAKALITKPIDTTAGKKYKGSTATDVSPVVDTA